MDTKEQLKLISTHLILNASNLRDLGLYRGKMGIVLFFCHYARYLQDLIYEDFASVLLDEIYEELHTSLSTSFDDGLCGVGWGIEYLVQHDFMDGDTDEILTDIDRQIMERDVRRIYDCSLATGLAGIIYYVIVRLTTLKRKENQSKPFDLVFLSDLLEAVHKNEKMVHEYEVVQLFGRFRKCLEHDYSFEILPSLPTFLYRESILSINEIKKTPLGLESGLAGLGMKLMLL